MDSDVLVVSPPAGVQSAFVGPGIPAVELLSLGLTAVQALLFLREAVSQRSPLRERVGQRTETEAVQGACVQNLHVDCCAGDRERLEPEEWCDLHY